MIPVPQCLLTPLEFPRKLLLGPGPSTSPPRVLAAGAMPMMGEHHPEAIEIMNDIKAGIQYLFQTRNRVTMALSASGHGAMECACCNLVEPGDTVLVAVNGVWGDRFADMVTRNRAHAKTINKPAGQVFTLADIEQGLIAHRPSLLFITHGESSGTTLQPLEGIGQLCHRYQCLLLVDSVAACGGVPLLMDQWHIDILYSGSQKVLNCPPGASPISFNEAAWKKIVNRQAPVYSFYFDVKLLANYWGCDDQPIIYHHTGPISNYYALREGLAIIAEEGLEKSWARHKKCERLLHEGLKELGLQLFVPDPAATLPTVTGVVPPADISWKAVADYLMLKYKIEIGGGLYGPTIGKQWRIGFMGYNATPHNVQLLLGAMKDALHWCRAHPQAKI